MRNQTPTTHVCDPTQKETFLDRMTLLKASITVVSSAPFLDVARNGISLICQQPPNMHITQIQLISQEMGFNNTQFDSFLRPWHNLVGATAHKVSTLGPSEKYILVQLIIEHGKQKKSDFDLIIY
jgi:hypothetical protein